MVVVAQRYGEGHRILLTGGAGFVPSHLVDALIARGAQVVAVDNFVTGVKDNVAHLADHPRFTLVEADVSRAAADRRGARRPVRRDPALRVAGQPDRLRAAARRDPPGRLARHAAPAGAGRGRRRPVPDGLHLRGVRRPAGAPAAGDLLGQRQPDRRPQRLRRGEALLRGGHHGLPPRPRRSTSAIVRIFNTYGPRMRPDDGRAIPTFISQALRGEPITVHGTGDADPLDLLRRRPGPRHPAAARLRRDRPDQLRHRARDHHAGAGRDDRAAVRQRLDGVATSPAPPTTRRRAAPT